MPRSSWSIALLVNLSIAFWAGAQTVAMTVPAVTQPVAITPPVAVTPTVLLTQNALVNRDVVTLAKAGFNEDFIVDLIHTSQTHFDTSVNGLTEMAREGLTERLIRVMMGTATEAGGPPPQATFTTTAAAAPEPHERTQVLRRSETALALASQTPYRHSSSMLWGLWKKEIEVGAMPHANPVAPQLGKADGQVQVRRPTPAPGDTHYVVFP